MRLKKLVSQKVQNLAFFGKIDGFFEKKLEFFFKFGKFGKFALECVSNVDIS